jgi:hypothetical protein
LQPSYFEGLFSRISHHAPVERKTEQMKVLTNVGCSDGKLLAKCQAPVTWPQNQKGHFN